jgi:hypothetical protein
MDAEERRKKRQYQREFRARQKSTRITTGQVRAEEKQAAMFDTSARPGDGLRCSVDDCKAVLVNYEIAWGKCLKHKHGSIIARREMKPTIAAVSGD